MSRLRDRFGPYDVTAVQLEARRGLDTRADMLVLGHGGSNLPVEVKRHYHSAIWTAASTQLQGYASSEGADGFGIYLVFWYGNVVEPMPARPDGADGPTSGEELERQLREDLDLQSLNRTEVVVMDVSDPNTGTTGRPRRKRRKTYGPPRPQVALDALV